MNSNYPHPRQDSLLEYMKSRKEQVVVADRKQELADHLGTTPAQLQQVAYGNRPLKLEAAIEMDKHTKGELSMFVLCPSVDWDYVAKALARFKKATKKAPK